MLPEIGEALRRFAEMDGFALGADAEAGGLQLPSTVGTAAATWFTAANIGTICYAFLTQANAALLHQHGSEEPAVPLRAADAGGALVRDHGDVGGARRQTRWATSPPVLSPTGTPTGSPAPRCGSPAATTRLAENIVHLVLARLPEAPAGTRGDLAVRGPQVPGGGRRQSRRAQRRRDHRDQPQARLPGHGQHRPGLRQRRVHAGRCARRGRLPRR
ncbi:hypothetical protein [Nocardioides convexus]|uniref:hypothetical protein n=1 Tax=Nocardioides convexus TaxID=2712224 RepID=UPI002418560C|nr:hypothetical protein [Nocardioides convexus]